MTFQQFKNLVDIGQIKQEPGDQKEFDGLLQSGRTRLKDSRMDALSLESRFDLAYNAAHALSLAALRWHGYRSENRYIVFQCLQHTLGSVLKSGGFWLTATTCATGENTRGCSKSMNALFSI